jgi:predicted RNA-binding Zn-ribbon protein involved in translation (DUF1610 family)
MSQRRILIGALIGQVLLIVAYKVVALQVLFYLNLGWAATLAGIAWNLRCPSCGKRQIFRGWSLLDLRLPAEKCYSCGYSLKQ